MEGELEKKDIWIPNSRNKEHDKKMEENKREREEYEKSFNNEQ